MRIRGAIAIITGVSSGIGEAIAVEFARRGATVVGVARRKDRLDATIERCRSSSPDSFAYPGDVAERAVCDGAAAAVMERFGRVDIVVNNAGISPGEDPVHHAVADAMRIMAVNFFGPVYLSGAVLPSMVERRAGSIVNVTSVSGAVPNPGEPAYGASKAALARWSHGLALDLHDAGVHVGVLSPGPIATEIWGQAPENGYGGKLYPPEVVARAAARMVEHRLVQLTAPRYFGALGAVYPLLGRPFRWGLRRYAASSHS